MEINIPKTIKVNAKTLKLHLKVSDRFTASLVDAQGAVIKEHDGYVPNFMPGNHFGDYVILDIDIDSGQITNWTQPTAEEIEAFVKEGN